jgi:hypothetical protein
VSLLVLHLGRYVGQNREYSTDTSGDRFMAASKVLGEETVAGQGGAQQQQTGSGGSYT